MDQLTYLSTVFEAVEFHQDHSRILCDLKFPGRRFNVLSLDEINHRIEFSTVRLVMFFQHLSTTSSRSYDLLGQRFTISSIIRAIRLVIQEGSSTRISSGQTRKTGLPEKLPADSNQIRDKIPEPRINWDKGGGHGADL